MRIKPDSIPPVEMNVCSFIMARIPRLDKLMEKYTRDEAIITSGSESGAPHMKGSKHFSLPLGEAIDVRHWGIVALSHTGRMAFFRELSNIFGDLKFDIIEHITHIHIEFDPVIIPSSVLRYKVNGVRIMDKRKKKPVPGMIRPIIDLPPIQFESKFRKVVNKGYDVIKVTSNIIGRHYAGVTIFKKEKDEGILDMIRRILKEFLELIRRRP